MRLRFSFIAVILAGLSSCGLLELNGDGCQSDADCRRDDICDDDGACVECLGDRDCDDGEVCDDGDCRSGENGEEGEGEGEQCQDEHPASQALFEPCCTGHGVDACGAELFCAAFDGREQTTCYLEGSRLDAEECGEDRHCASGSCNQEVSQCRSQSGTECTTEIGCAGSSLRCLSDTCSDGAMFEACEQRSDCRFDSAACVDETCVSGRSIGSGCETAEECTAEVMPDGNLIIPACIGSECLFPNHGACVFQATSNPDEVCTWGDDGFGGWCSTEPFPTGWCRSEPTRACVEQSDCAEWGECLMVGTCE